MTEKKLDDVGVRIERTPRKYLKNLSQQADVS
jgi:hypothetical protein